MNKRSIKKKLRHIVVTIYAQAHWKDVTKVIHWKKKLWLNIVAVYSPKGQKCINRVYAVYYV